MAETEPEVLNSLLGRDCGPAIIRRPVRAFEQSEIRTRKKMADREGFEPSEPREELGGLAIHWFQPLTHLSVGAVCNLKISGDQAVIEGKI